MKEERSATEVTKKRLVKQPFLFKAMNVCSRQAESLAGQCIAQVVSLNLDSQCLGKIAGSLHVCEFGFSWHRYPIYEGF